MPRPPAPPVNRKAYLGDAVYIDYDGQRLTLTTSNGLRDTNAIVLEPEVWFALQQYVTKLAEEKREGGE